MSKPRQRKVAAEENIGSLQGDHSYIYLIWGSHCNRQFDKTRMIFFHSPSQQQKNVIHIAGNRY